MRETERGGAVILVKTSSASSFNRYDENFELSPSDDPSVADKISMEEIFWISSTKTSEALTLVKDASNLHPPAQRLICKKSPNRSP